MYKTVVMQVCTM